jgi:hypothetical protein
VGPSAAEPEANRARLRHVHPRRRAHGLHEPPLDVVQAAEAIARANEGVPRAGVDESEPLEVPEVEDQVEARFRGVPCRRHAQCLKSLRLHLAGDAHRRVLATEGLGDAVVVSVDQHRLLEVGVESRHERAHAVRIDGGHCRGVPAEELREEREDQLTPQAAPMGDGLT